MAYKILFWSTFVCLCAVAYTERQVLQQRDIARGECLYRASIQKGLEKELADSAKLLDAYRQQFGNIDGSYCAIGTTSGSLGGVYGLNDSDGRIFHLESGTNVTISTPCPPNLGRHDNNWPTPAVRNFMPHPIIPPFVPFIHVR